MPRTQQEWTDQVKQLVRAEITRRGIGYRELAEKLAAIGVHDTERNISNKIVRGGFSAVWFVQVMAAIGAKTIHLDGDD